MAKDDEEKTEEGEAGEKKKGGKGKLIIIIVLAIVLLGAGVGGTMFALGMFGGDEEVAEGEGEPVEELKPPALYMEFKPAFIVTYDVRGRQRFLQLSITAMTRNQAVLDGMELHMPLIRNRLVLLLSGEVYDDLQTNEGKELLRQKALEAVQEILQKEIGDAGLEEILFTNFVMQ